MIDWGAGEYERTARLLEPAAEVAVRALAPQPGERILDVACGTGNAALLTAGAGARTMGVDLAPRLLDQARSRAGAAGLRDVEFVEGDATALPVGDATYDGAISVFGVIFAEPERAAAELLRAVRPGGRIVLTTWAPAGPIHAVGGIIRAALGAPPELVRWGDPEVVGELFAAREVIVEQEALAFTASSVDAYMDDVSRYHPMSRMAGVALRAAGKEESTMAEIRDTLAEANEDPAAFRTTSTYFVVRLTV